MFVAALVIGNDALDLTDTVDIRIVPLHQHRQEAPSTRGTA
jgi:hypothetical protein